MGSGKQACSVSSPEAAGRVIVCGGRDYRDQSHVVEVLDNLSALGKITTIVQGGANGADLYAELWAESRDIPFETWPADWRQEGRRAGPLRNQRMLNAGACLVVAFPGGRGTADMVRRARKAGVPVIEAARTAQPEDTPRACEAPQHQGENHE